MKRALFVQSFRVTSSLFHEDGFCTFRPGDDVFCQISFIRFLPFLIYVACVLCRCCLLSTAPKSMSYCVL